MVNPVWNNEVIKVPRMPIKNIGIIYCTSTQSAEGRENERLADGEVIDVAFAVKDALLAKGYQAETVNLDPQEIADLRRFDWVFNLAESIYGFPLTEYEVAEEMERSNTHFTGSGSKALKACLDKALTKLELLRNGIETPAFQVFQPGEPVLNTLKYPLFVKPIREEGSIGISIDSFVRNDIELKRQVQKIHEVYHQAALVEEYIEGRDISASVIGNGPDAFVLPLSEIVYTDYHGPKMLSFISKWSSDPGDYIGITVECPCILDTKTQAFINDIALHATQVMGCRDYTRVDFRLRGNTPLVLEVNANPCLNPDNAGFILSGKTLGYSYADIVAKILEVSIQDRLQVPSAGC